MIEPDPYQNEGVKFLAARKCAILGDEPGVGKSAQAIWGADAVGARRILCITPASIKADWGYKWEDVSMVDRTVQIVWTGRDKIGKSDITVVNYDLFLNPSIRKQLRDIEWDLVIIDEGHYLKSRVAKRTKYILGTHGVVHSAKRIWMLSGTPAPNNPSELFVWLKVFGAYKGDYHQFVDDFCEGYDDGYSFKITGGKNLPRLREILKPIMLRRKQDVIDGLPELILEHVNVEPGEIDESDHFPEFEINGRAKKVELIEQLKMIEAVAAKTGINDFASVLASIKDNMALYRKFNGIQKLEPVIELVKQDLKENGINKLVIFAVHRDVIHALYEGLREFRPVKIYGGTPVNKRKRYIDKFREEYFHKPSECRVLIGQIVAAGTGLDGLQDVCNEAIIVEQDWVPANNAQAIMRLHRRGQNKRVRVRTIRLPRAKSVDWKIDEALTRKLKTLIELYDS